jgi:hypothetical protein
MLSQDGNPDKPIIAAPAPAVLRKERRFMLMVIIDFDLAKVQKTVGFK